MRAENASTRNAKISMLIAAAEESVNMLSAPSRILFVMGMADDAADINKYATICIPINFQMSMTNYLSLVLEIVKYLHQSYEILATATICCLNTIQPKKYFHLFGQREMGKKKRKGMELASNVICFWTFFWQEISRNNQKDVSTRKWLRYRREGAILFSKTLRQKSCVKLFCKIQCDLEGKERGFLPVLPCVTQTSGNLPEKQWIVN